MSETSTSQLTQIVNRIGRKPFAAAGGTALWKAIDDVGRRQEEIRSRLAARLDRQAQRLDRQAKLAAATHGRVTDLEAEIAQLTDEVQKLTTAMSELHDRVRAGAEELANLSSLPRPRATPGQQPRPGRVAPGKPEARLSGPIHSLSSAVGISRTE
ncbi:MAG: hypothetical protein ACE367_06150 [Acidimicrobiales bacterium]